MSIKAEISLDSTKAEAQAERAGAAIGGKLAKSSQGAGKGLFEGAESALTKINSGVSLLSRGFSALSSSIAFIDKMGDLKDSVSSVLDPARDVNAEMKTLLELADSPGLEFESVAKAHSTFLALGKSSEESMDIIKEIGNALQQSGKDPEELEKIVEILTRMTDAGKPNIKMLHSLAMSSGIFRKAFQDGFGEDSLSELEAMNMSGEQFTNNFVNGLRQVERATGDAADKMGSWMDRIMAFGGRAGATLQDILGDWGSGNFSGKPEAKAVRENPVIEENRIYLEKKRNEEIKESKAAHLKQIQEQISLENELALSKVKEKGGDEFSQATQKLITTDLEIQVSLNKDLAKLMKDLSLSEKDASDILKERVYNSVRLREEAEKIESAKKREAAYEEEISAEKSNAEHQAELDFLDEKKAILKKIADLSKEETEAKEKASKANAASKRERDLTILEQKSKGHGGKAERMQRDADIADKQKELEGLGMSPQGAKKQAAREVQAAEDQAYRERTGRSRIHGNRPDPDQAYGNAGLAHSSFPKGTTTKLTPTEVAATQGKDGAATKAMEGLTVALKNLEQAAKKYNATPLN